MILRREIRPDWMFLGERITSWSTPSMRYRTRTSTSVGSMWMSDARSATAWLIRRLTSLTIGASSVTSLTRERSSSASISLAAKAETSSALPSMRWCLSRASRIAPRVATTVLTSAPVIVRMSSMATTLEGSAIATTSRLSSHPTGTAWKRRASESEMRATALGSMV